MRRCRLMNQSIGRGNAMARPSEKIDEERVCIDSLVQCLGRLPGGQEISFRKETSDPPDYWLNLGGRDFAVEVTAVTTDMGYRDLCRKLHQSVKQACALVPELAGAYGLEVSRRPEIPKRNSKEWHSLVARACEGIHSLGGRPINTSSTLLSDANGSLKIRRLSDRSDFGFNLGMAGPTEFRWEGEAHQELSGILAARIASKKEKIDKKGVLDVCPDVILALYDAYGFCSPEQARAALLSLDGYGWVHSIFWAASFSDTGNANYPGSPGRIGIFLFSKEESWGQ